MQFRSCDEFRKWMNGVYSFSFAFAHRTASGYQIDRKFTWTRGFMSCWERWIINFAANSLSKLCTPSNYSQLRQQERLWTFFALVLNFNCDAVLVFRGLAFSLTLNDCYVDNRWKRLPDVFVLSPPSPATTTHFQELDCPPTLAKRN